MYVHGNGDGKWGTELYSHTVRQPLKRSYMQETIYLDIEHSGLNWTSERGCI